MWVHLLLFVIAAIVLYALNSPCDAKAGMTLPPNEFEDVFDRALNQGFWGVYPTATYDGLRKRLAALYAFIPDTPKSDAETAEMFIKFTENVPALLEHFYEADNAGLAAFIHAAQDSYERDDLANILPLAGGQYREEILQHVAAIAQLSAQIIEKGAKVAAEIHAGVAPQRIGTFSYPAARESAIRDMPHFYPSLTGEQISDLASALAKIEAFLSLPNGPMGVFPMLAAVHAGVNVFLRYGTPAENARIVLGMPIVQQHPNITKELTKPENVARLTAAITELVPHVEKFLIKLSAVGQLLTHPDMLPVYVDPRVARRAYRDTQKSPYEVISTTGLLDKPAPVHDHRANTGPIDDPANLFDHRANTGPIDDPANLFGYRIKTGPIDDPATLFGY